MWEWYAMGWSPNYQSIRRPDLLNDFFLSVGKALYFAASFEAKCRFVLRCDKLADKYRESEDVSATVTLARELRDPMLGQTVNQMQTRSGFSRADVQLLEEAKEARNWIVHECADIGDLADVPVQLVSERLANLRRKLRCMIDGDNVVSRWVYEIEEGEPAPDGIQSDYPSIVDEWIFRPPRDL